VADDSTRVTRMKASAALVAFGGRPLAWAGANPDPNIVRVAGGDAASSDGDVQIAQQQEAQQRTPTQKSGAAQKPPQKQEPGRGYGNRPQAEIEKGMTPVQIKINRDQAFRELTRQPMTTENAKSALPDDWERTKPADLVDEIKRAAERHNVPIQLLARLLYQEGKFGERDKLKKPLVMESTDKDQPLGYAQITTNTLNDLKRWARERGDTRRSTELEIYSPANREKAFDASAELLAYLYRFMDGSWPRAIGAYNKGRNFLRPWLNGAQGKKFDPATSKGKWTEMSEYLTFILRGATEDPTTADVYTFHEPNRDITRDRIYRPSVPSDTRLNP